MIHHQQCHTENSQIRQANEPSNENASHDVIMGSESTNVCLHMHQGKC